MKRNSCRLALLAPFALAACGQQDTGQPLPDATATASGAPVSILRPDVEQPPAEVTLNPLETVIPFTDGGSELSEAALADLATVRESPQVAAGGPIILRGHSDAGGNDAVNMRVSVERAEAVRDWLVEMGVAEDRIEVIGFGEQNPIAPNALPDGSPNEEGRALNRRVDVSVLLPTAEDEKSDEAPDDPPAQPAAGA